MEVTLVKKMRHYGFGFGGDNSCVKAYYTVLYVTSFVCGDIEKPFAELCPEKTGTCTCSHSTEGLKYRSEWTKRNGTYVQNGDDPKLLLDWAVGAQKRSAVLSSSFVHRAELI